MIEKLIALAGSIISSNADNINNTRKVLKGLLIAQISI
jgi:hypothetical protein